MPRVAAVWGVHVLADGDVAVVGDLADVAGYGAPFAALAAVSAGAAVAVLALRGRGWLRSG
jgi:hypothetical protein